MKQSFKASDFVTDAKDEPTSLVQIETIQNEKEIFQSTNFFLKEKFIKTILNTISSNDPTSFHPEYSQKLFEFSEFKAVGSDVTVISGWKNIENISAKLIECYDDIVVLECLIDKETHIYEEREFRLSLFEGYDLTIGNLFYLRFFDRQNETRMEIHDDPALTFAADFPKRDFSELFRNSKLFNK
jgi:hypothetical protein